MGIRLGDFGLGLVEGLATSGAKGIQKAMDDLDGKVSRLSEIRMNKAANEMPRYKKEFRENEEEIKSLSAALGPDGPGILHSLITSEGGYSYAKSVIPAVVKKMQDTNMSASQILKYKPTEGYQTPSTKQLAELITVPMNIPDLDYGKALEGSGSNILNIFASSEDAIPKYMKRTIESDMALSGLSEKPVSYGEIGAAGKLSVDRFELSLTNNLKENLPKLKAAAENETDPDKKKEYKERAFQTEMSILAQSDKPLTNPQVRSFAGSFSKSAAAFANLKGNIDPYTKDWIPAISKSENAKLVSDQGQEMADALRWSKMNKADYGLGYEQTARGLVPNKLPKGFKGLEGKEGEYITPDRLMHAAGQNGYKIAIVPASDNIPPYITISNEKVSYTKDGGGGSGGVPEPDKTGFTKTTKETISKIDNDRTISSAKNKFLNSSDSTQQKIQAKSIKNRLIALQVADWKSEYKRVMGMDWKEEYNK